MNQETLNTKIAQNFINAVNAMQINDPVVVIFEGKDTTITPKLADAMKRKVIDVAQKVFIQHQHLGLNTQQITYFLDLMKDTVGRKLDQADDVRHFAVHVFAFFVKALEFQKNNSNFS